MAGFSECPPYKGFTYFGRLQLVTMIRLGYDTINQLALLMAPNGKNNPIYLNGDQLVAFFNQYGHQDWYDFTDGNGICTPDIGEGLARVEYVRKRLEEYNKNENVLEVVKRFVGSFNHNETLIERINEILEENKPQARIIVNDEGKVEAELLNKSNYMLHRTFKMFISYSHDDDDHIAWVKQFAEDLKSEGFNIVYDQDNGMGASWTRFMNRGLANNERVLIIGTPEYCKRSQKSSGGTAYESTIINISLMRNLDSEKFIPILRRGSYETSFPILVSDRNGIDFRNDSKYEENLKELVKKLYTANSTK